MLVRENEAREVAIPARGQRLGFLELKAACKELGEGSALPLAAAPIPDPTSQASSSFESFLEKRFSAKHPPSFSGAACNQN